MLPTRHRLTAAVDFRRAIRSGRRKSTASLVVHYYCCDQDGHPVRAGFSVGRAVGNSVVRHRTVRRLRHACAPHLSALPDGSLLVVRAKPEAARASFEKLESELVNALRHVGALG